MTTTVATPLASPFRGLAPFGDGELDALLFFGRERETEVAVANLLASRLTILYGPSGVGKSSLLHAGVARRIRELAGRRAIGRGPDGAVVVVASWADDPVTTIAEAVASEVRSLVKRSVIAPPAGASLADVIEHWSTVLDGDLYLVLDQLEEYFVYHEDARGPGTLIGELPEVVLRQRLRANVLLSLRDDALAQLDVFKASIPNLFANYLRLDRLDRAAATAAVTGPLQRWNDIVPAAQRVDLEPELLDLVLAQAAVAGEPDRVEPAVLQLVMERLWQTELDQGSLVLQASSLLALGGAGAIVRAHLDRALSGLDGTEQDAAARMFEHLVTPSGTKVAQSVSDLAEFARVPVAVVAPMLASLGRERILRPLDEGKGEADRYEIFHDVLADAILGWRRRRVVEQERVVSRRRQRRLAAVALASLAVAAAMLVVALYALSARSDARHQAAVAVAARQEVTKSRKGLVIALGKTRRAKNEADQAEQNEAAAVTTAQNETAIAEQNQKQAETEKVQADNATAKEKTAETNAINSANEATNAEAKAKKSAKAAQDSATAYRHARDRAQTEENLAKQNEKHAKEAELKAKTEAQVALAGEHAFDALALLGTDPQRSLALAVEAAKSDRSPLVERALRDGLLASHEQRSLPLGAPAEAMAVSADAPRAAVSTTGDAAAVIDLAGGRKLATLTADAPLKSIAVSSDGSTIATGDKGGHVILWSAAGKRLRTLTTKGAVDTVAFSRDGRILAASGQDRIVMLWDASTGALLRPLKASVVVQSLVFSPAGDRLLAFGRLKTIQAFDVSSGKLDYTLTQADQTSVAAFSPDGSTIVTGGRGTAGAYMWSAADGSSLHRLTPAEDIDAIAFSPDAKLVATASRDATARVWDAKTGQLQETLIGHGAPILGLAFSPDSRLVISASSDRTARIWDVGGFDREVLAGHGAGVVAARFLGSASRAVTASADGTVRFWDANFDPPMRTIGVHQGPGPATGVAFVGQGTAVSAGGDGFVRFWSIARRRPIRTINAGVPLTDVAATTDATTVAASAKDGRVFVWHVNGAPVATLSGPAPAQSVAFSPDGRELAVAGGDKNVRLYRLPGRSVVTLPQPAAVNDAAFSPDGRLLATALADGTAVVWRLSDRKPVRTLAGHVAAVLSVAFSHNGKLLVTTSLDHDLRIWDVATGASLRTLVGHVALVSGAAFSADDRWIASAGPTRVGIWAVRRDDLPADLLFYLNGTTKSPFDAVAFSPTGHTIVSAGADGVIRSYDCTLCGGLDELLSLARQRLRALQ